MIVKIQINGQEDLGKFYTALSSSDNNPELEEGKRLFDGSGDQMVMLVEDIKQNTEIDAVWGYTLTLKVAEFIGEMSSNGDHGPDWDTFKPVPGEWILKIFNAIGRYPLEAKTSEPAEAEPTKPDLETTLRVLADIQNSGKNLPFSTDDEPYPEFMHRILDDPHDRTIGYQWLRNILVALANTNENEFRHLLASPIYNGSASTDRFAEMTRFFFSIKPPVIFSMKDAPGHLIDPDLAELLLKLDAPAHVHQKVLNWVNEVLSPITVNVPRTDLLNKYADDLIAEVTKTINNTTYPSKSIEITKAIVGMFREHYSGQEGE